MDNYTRAVTVVRVLDGDTFVADVALGFYVTVRMSCRLTGLNAAEHNQPGGPEARAALADLLKRGPVSVTSVGVDKYAGRFDALVKVDAPNPDASHVGDWSVNGWLITHGYAVTWDGTGKRPLVPWPPKPIT